MKRCLATAAAVVLCLATVRADLSFTQTMTIEGPMAAMMAGKPITMTTHVKGTKSRTDMDVMGNVMSSITDLTTKQVTLLHHAEKTAQVLSTTTPLAMPANVPMPKFDVSFKATGDSKNIDGVSTAQHAFTIAVSLGEMSGGQLGPEAAEMMKDVRFVLNGTIWIAKTGPGTAEFMAFQKATTDANLSAVLGSILGGQPGKSAGGIDKIFTAISEAPGLPYLTEITMAVEGSGPMVEMMKQQMSGMKMIQKTTKISTDPLPDDLFTVPADYKAKQ